MTRIVRTRDTGGPWATTVESAGGAAGFMESVVLAAPRAVSGIANATTAVVEWDIVTALSFGTDITLNGDAKTWEVLEGWYQISVAIDLFSDTAQVMDGQSLCDLDSESALAQAYGPTGVVVNPSGHYGFTTPPILFDGINQSLDFQVKAYGEHAGDPDTWSIAPSGGVKIWKVLDA